MAAVQAPRAEFESHSAHFATTSCLCHRCGIEMELDPHKELLCKFCENGSNAIRSGDLSAETLGLGRVLGVLRFTDHTQEEEEEEDEEEEEEEENGGIVNYFDCIGNNPDDFWIEEKEEDAGHGEISIPWEDVVISGDFYDAVDVRQRGENQSLNLWAEVDPGVFEGAVEPGISVEEEEEEEEAVFDLRGYAEDDEVDFFKRGLNGESDEFGLFRRDSIVGLGFGSQAPGSGEEEEWAEEIERNLNSNPNPRLNLNSNPSPSINFNLNPSPSINLNSNPNPRLNLNHLGDDNSDLFEWNSVAEDEVFDSSSDDDEVHSSITDSDSEVLCIACTSWDSFGLEENNEGNHEFNSEEWEELYGGEDAEVYSRPVGVEENQQNSDIREEVEPTGNFGWTSVMEDFRGIEFTYEEDDADADAEVDLDVDVDTYFGDPEDYADEAGYEVLMEQFAEVNNFPRGAPPTSKAVLDSLPSFFIRQEEIDNGNAWCPICKEVLNIEETVKVLPCSHHYHGDCILPWLRCRNSCPVCRFELPTDDPEYELQRKQVIRQT